MVAKREDGIIIIGFLLTICIITTIIISESIFAKLLDSSVATNISTNQINNLFLTMKLIDASSISSTTNSSEICKMPDCPKGQACTQVCPESLLP